jgi:Carboxypeptidase regulatory-like domain/TonB dependent receptor-like, beta-barrel
MTRPAPLQSLRNGIGFCVLIAGLLVAAASANAQSIGATLQGTITDDQGAVMPGATIVITNTETGWTRTQITDERGWYRAIALPPGAYELRAEISGFANQVRTGLVLTVGQEATVNLSLKVATVQETVTVTGASPLVETSKNTLGTTITRDELDTLPLSGRNFAALANLTPGIAGVGGGGVQASGQTTRSNSYLVDGASNDDTLVASQRGGFSLEAVREFAVMANQFSAEYGMASGAIVSVVTRSGTNTFQGRVFAFHRDDAFDAQNPFSKAQGSGKAPFSQQRYGGFAGGPIFRDKLHYFGAYEVDRQRRTSVVTSALVPVNEREFPNPSDGQQAFVKSDYRMSNQQTLSLRYRADKTKVTGNGIGGLNTRERGSNNNGLDQDIVANHTMILSSRMLNEFRFQFARRSTFTDTKGWSVDGTPEINRPSGNFGKAYNLPQGRDENRYQVVNMFSYALDTHQLKAGGDISLIRAKAFFPNNRDGIFRFRTDAPFNPSDPSTYPYQYEVNRIDPNQDLPNNLISFFVQDTWRFRRSLTFNLGVRYDLETAFKGLTGVPDDHNNVSPRLGVVWDPFTDGRTAIRGGYGLYIDQSFLNVQLNVAAASRSQELVIANPGYPDPLSQGTPAGAAPSTAVIAPHPQIPSSRTLSAGIKREISPGLAVSVDGVYSRGDDQFNWIDINLADPVTRVRPDPTRGRVMQYSMEGHAWYKALLVGAEGRAGKGPGRPIWSVAYTLSTALRDVEGFLFTAQDMRNPDAEKSLASNDRRHQLVANATWMLPWDIQVGAIVQARSGLPWTVTTGVDSNGDTFSVDRPDLAVPGGNPLDRATYSTNFTGRVGNLGRNTVIGPNYVTLDGRVSKFVRIQRTKIEAFVEAFNVTNRVNLGTPVGNLRSANFGTATGLASGANSRQVEIGFRVDF